MWKDTAFDLKQLMAWIRKTLLETITPTLASVRLSSSSHHIRGTNVFIEAVKVWVLPDRVTAVTLSNVASRTLKAYNLQLPLCIPNTTS